MTDKLQYRDTTIQALFTGELTGESITKCLQDLKSDPDLVEKAGIIFALRVMHLFVVGNSAEDIKERMMHSVFSLHKENWLKNYKNDALQRHRYNSIEVPQLHHSITHLLTEMRPATLSKLFIDFVNWRSQQIGCVTTTDEHELEQIPGWVDKKDITALRNIFRLPG